MKKLSVFFLSFFAITLFSCNSNDEPVDQPVQPTSSLKATINGVEESFDLFDVKKVPGTADDGTPYTDYYVTATKSGNPTLKVTFQVTGLQTGDEACYYFDYILDGIEYDIEIDNSFLINVSSNSANNIKGTFSGKLYDFELKNAITFVNGTFDINF